VSAARLAPASNAAPPGRAEPAAFVPSAARLIASLPLAVVVVNPAGQIAALNPAAEQLFGTGLARLIGRPLAEVLSFADPAVAGWLADAEAMVSARALDAVVGGRGPCRLDVTFSAVADAPGWRIATLADGHHEVLRGDDRDSPRAPEILAHEIKNPLAAIRGAAQLLARQRNPADQPLTALITAEVDRIARLIDQMQALSRRTVPPVAACNLHEAVRRGCAVLAAGDRQCAIEEQFDPSLPAVLGNADALVQVVINLLANAHDAVRGHPAPRILVRTRFASGLQRRGPSGTVALPIELRVSDNGPGVEAALRDHLFEPFVSAKRGGQGLGLALVRKLVHEMHGHVGFDRQAAAGGETAWTHFRVHLPQAPLGRA